MTAGLDAAPTAPSVELGAEDERDGSGRGQTFPLPYPRAAPGGECDARVWATARELGLDRGASARRSATSR